MRGLPCILALTVFGVGCSATYVADRYSPSVENALVLRELATKVPTAKLSVGKFDRILAYQPTQHGPQAPNEIECRVGGWIVPPDNLTYAQYIRGALQGELRLAGLYSESGGIPIVATIKNLDFSSNSGAWVIDASITIGPAKPFEVAVQHNFSVGDWWDGRTACDRVSRELMPAIQDFVGKLLHAPEFRAAVSGSAPRS